MPATLTSLRSRLIIDLMDPDQEIWDNDTLDEAIRKALDEYAKAHPKNNISAITLAGTGREISIASLSGLLAVQAVWLPYTAAAPEHPPNTRFFEHWFEAETLYFPDGDEPRSGQVARIFYQSRQTLDGLDSATATSFPPGDETIILAGCAGYAATSRSVDLMEQVTRDRLTAQQIRAWGLSRLSEFRAGLKLVTRQAALSGVPWVSTPSLDRHDRAGWA